MTRQFERILTLCRHKWAIPVLGLLSTRSGCRLAELRGKTGASATTLRKTLDSLMEAGWVSRNEGYGHPLRPEYLVTAEGKGIAVVCGDLIRLLSDPQPILSRWAIAVIWAIGQDVSRFSEIRSRLGGITDRALARTLRDLQADGLLVRKVVDASPPTTRYSISSSCQSVVAAVCRI